MIIEKIKKNKMIVIVIVAYIFTFFYKNELFYKALTNSEFYLIEMLKIMPAVFIISALLTNWVPDETIKKVIGKSSGFKGKVFSMIVGAISAGPIYAAFPVSLSLLKKGASISNIVVIISAWAVVKIPMFFVESKFLGLKFTIVRYLLTIPAIFLLGYLTEKFVKDVKFESDNSNEKVETIANILPGFNCKACGFSSCETYAKHISENPKDINKCKPGGKVLIEKLQKI